MPPIELGPLGPQAARGISAADPRPAHGKPIEAKSGPGQPVANATARSHAAANSAVMRSAALDAGPPLVDFERIAVIRHAIERDNYPVIPMRVADAMIAAGLLLRSGK